MFCIFYVVQTFLEKSEFVLIASNYYTTGVYPTKPSMENYFLLNLLPIFSPNLFACISLFSNACTYFYLSGPLFNLSPVRTYFYLHTLIFICENFLLFMIICENPFLSMIICENLCKLFLSVRIFSYLSSSVRIF